MYSYRQVQSEVQNVVTYIHRRKNIGKIISKTLKM